MKQNKNPTVITSVEEIFKFLLFGSGNILYLSNSMNPAIIEHIFECCDFEIEKLLILMRENLLIRI